MSPAGGIYVQLLWRCQSTGADHFLNAVFHPIRRNTPMIRLPEHFRSLQPFNVRWQGQIGDLPRVLIEINELL